LDLVINCCQKEIIVKRASLSRENFRALMMMVEEDVGIIGEMVVVCRSPRMDNLLLFSIIVRVCFVYEFCLVWN